MVVKYVIIRAKRGSTKRSAAKLHREAMQRASLAWFPEFILSQGRWTFLLIKLWSSIEVVVKCVITRAKQGSTKWSAAKLHCKAMQRASLAWFPEYIPSQGGCDISFD